MVENPKMLYEIDSSSLSLDHPAMGIGDQLSIVTHLVTRAHTLCTETVEYSDQVLQLLDPGSTRHHELGAVDVSTIWHFEAVQAGTAWVQFWARADDNRQALGLPVSSWRVISEP